MKIIDDLIELIMGDPKIRESKTLANSFRVRFAKPFFVCNCCCNFDYFFSFHDLILSAFWLITLSIITMNVLFVKRKKQICLIPYHRDKAVS